MLVTKEKITIKCGTKDKNTVPFKPRWKTGLLLMFHLEYYISFSNCTVSAHSLNEV